MIFKIELTLVEIIGLFKMPPASVKVPLSKKPEGLLRVMFPPANVTVPLLLKLVPAIVPLFTVAVLVESTLKLLKPVMLLLMLILPPVRLIVGTLVILPSVL